jgi:hypothetical protein
LKRKAAGVNLLLLVTFAFLLMLSLGEAKEEARLVLSLLSLLAALPIARRWPRTPLHRAVIGVLRDLLQQDPIGDSDCRRSRVATPSAPGAWGRARHGAGAHSAGFQNSTNSFG